jgi:hypothetical protein
MVVMVVEPEGVVGVWRRIVARLRRPAAGAKAARREAIP